MSAKPAGGMFRRMGRKIAEAPITLRAALVFSIMGMDGVSKLLFQARGSRIGLILKRFGAQVGPGCVFESQLIVHRARKSYANLTLGVECYVGQLVFLDIGERIDIGDHVTISAGVMILTHTDVGKSPLSICYPPEARAVHIMDGGYIGAGAVILQGVRIGECSVIAAGAVVTADVEPYSVVGGVPSRPLKQLDSIRKDLR